MSVLLAVGLVAGVKAYQDYSPKTIIQNVEVYNEAADNITVGPADESLSAALTPCKNDNGIESCYYSEGFYQATTTLFAIKNPFSATSTVDYFVMQGHTGTTAVDIYVGTSTKSTVPPASTGSTDAATAFGTSAPTLVNASAVATSSKFYIKNGQNAVYGSGQTPAGANSLTAIILGPTEYILGYASSTNNINVKDNSATTTTV